MAIKPWAVHICLCSRTPFLDHDYVSKGQYAFFFFFLSIFILFHSTISWLTEPQMRYALQNPNHTRAIFHPVELFTGKEP